jgi:hypothetical protein
LVVGRFKTANASLVLIEYLELRHASIILLKKREVPCESLA